MVTGEEDHRRGHPAFGEWNAGRRRRAERSGDAGNNLEVDPGLAQGANLFARTPENQRIAAFQPRHPKAAAGVGYHSRIDFLLADVLWPATLADIENRRARRDLGENLRSHEVVVEHHVRLAENALRLHGQQVGIARPGRHQVDFRGSGFGGRGAEKNDRDSGVGVRASAERLPYRLYWFFFFEPRTPSPEPR